VRKLVFCLAGAMFVLACANSATAQEDPNQQPPLANPDVPECLGDQTGWTTQTDENGFVTTYNADGKLCIQVGEKTTPAVVQAPASSPSNPAPRSTSRSELAMTGAGLNLTAIAGISLLLLGLPLVRYKQKRLKAA
jgi:hypothetical protein